MWQVRQATKRAPHLAPIFGAPQTARVGSWPPKQRASLGALGAVRQIRQATRRTLLGAYLWCARPKPLRQARPAGSLQRIAALRREPAKQQVVWPRWGRGQIAYCPRWVVTTLHAPGACSERFKGLRTKQSTLLGSYALKGKGATLGKAEIETLQGCLAHLFSYRRGCDKPIDWAGSLP